MRTIFVSDTQVGGRKCRRFPLVIAPDGGVQMEIMRFLVKCFRDGGSEATIQTYSGHLRDLYEQLAVDCRSLQSVSTEYLNGYREAISRRATSHYAAQVLRTVLAFLYYLEERGALVAVIGEDRHCAIVITRTKSGGISHALLKGSTSPKSNYCPSDRSIEILKIHGPRDSRLAGRFELMIDWCHVKGLRAKEVCALELDQLPDRDSIAKALEQDKSLEVRLRVTKGMHSRNVDVHPLLLSRTLRWIDTDRRDLMGKALGSAADRGVPFTPTNAIFIAIGGESHLSSKAFSNAVRQSFTRAVEVGDLTVAERVWAHGLRKRMINREVEARPRDDTRGGEESLRQQTGHASLNSLGRYVVSRP